MVESHKDTGIDDWREKKEKGLNTLLSFQPMGLQPWLLVMAVVVASIGTIQVLKGVKVID
ncbi:MAG: hypothetical protein K9H15_04985 [Bacteroidales bacterium]|nr:hypothetical protein [Bacteroidales bacterium]